MGINLGDVFPNFEAETTVGKIKFHDWVGGKDKWAVLCSHPDDFTPVCTTELGELNKVYGDFEKRGVKVIGLSCNDVDTHAAWQKDILHYTGTKGPFKYPIISDPKRDLAVELGMLDPDEKTKEGLPLTCRAVFVIGPEYKLKLSILYPATTGRNFHEVLRVIDSLQLTVNSKLATPVNWKPGEDCIVTPAIKTKEDEKKYCTNGGITRVVELPSGKQYLRFTGDPVSRENVKNVKK